MIDNLTFLLAANQRISGKRFGYSSALVGVDIAGTWVSVVLKN
jgi:hypothetical protein